MKIWIVFIVAAFVAGASAQSCEFTLLFFIVKQRAEKFGFSFLCNGLKQVNGLMFSFRKVRFRKRR